MLDSALLHLRDSKCQGCVIREQNACILIVGISCMYSIPIICESSTARRDLSAPALQPLNSFNEGRSRDKRLDPRTPMTSFCAIKHTKSENRKTLSLKERFDCWTLRLKMRYRKYRGRKKLVGTFPTQKCEKKNRCLQTSFQILKDFLAFWAILPSCAFFR